MRPAGLGHPFRIGERQHLAVAEGRPPAFPHAPCPALGEGAGVPGAGGPIAFEGLQPVSEMGVAPANPPLGDQGRDPGGPVGLSVLGRAQDHVRQPRRQGHVGQGLAVRGQHAGGVHRLQPAKQGLGLRQGGPGRRVEEGEIVGRLRPPAGHVQGQTRQVGVQDFRVGEGRQGAGLGLVPQPVADPGCGASRPPPPLVGGRPADPHGGQARQTAGGVKARHASLAGVDHHPDVFQGQAGLGDGGGQNHLANARRRRGHRPVLHLWIQGAVKRRDQHVVPAQAFGQALGRPHNLPMPRQEDQHAAGFLSQGALNGPEHGVLQPQGVAAPEIAGLHRIGAAQALDHRRVAHQPRHSRPVQGGRHDQQPQVVPQ